MKPVRDLTQGSIPVHLTRLAAPLIAGNLLQQLYNTIDAWVVGRFAGSLEFGATGIASSVMNLFLFAAVGACTGISVIFARLYGEGDLPAFRREHFLSLLAGLLCAAAASVLGILLIPVLLRLIRVPAELRGFVSAYLSIVLLGLPAAYLYNLYAALLRAVGRTGAVLAALAAAVAINLCLDLWFVARLGWGIRGAAWATVAAQAISAALCLLYLRIAAPELLFGRADCRLDRDLLRQTGRFSFVTALHQSGLYIGKLLVQGAVNTAGTDVINAYTAAARIEGFANSFGSSGAAATSVMTAQNLGAKEDERVRQTFTASFRLLLILGAVCSLLMYVTAGHTAAFMLGTRTGAAYESACGYIRIISLFYIFCFTGNAYVGSFNGVGRMSVPFMGTAGHITWRAVFSWLLVSRMGLNAVAIASGTGWILVNLFWSLCRQRKIAACHFA